MSSLKYVWDDFYNARGKVDLDRLTVLRYLNMASRKLDQMTGRHHMKSESLVTLSEAGQYLVPLPDNLRAISASWIRDPNGYKYRMRRMDAAWIYANYPSVDAVGDTDQDTGTPGYWDLGPSRFGNGYGYIRDTTVKINEADVFINAEPTTRSILIAPAVASTLVGGDLILYGTHWTPSLKGMSDTNFWVEHWPDALVFAAMWRFDTLHRDGTSSEDWLVQAKAELHEYHRQTAAMVSRDMPMQMDA